MGIDGIAAEMPSFVAFPVRPASALVQAEMHAALQDGNAVFAVIEQCNAVVVFGKVGILVIADLKAGLFKGGGTVIGPAQGTELNLIADTVGNEGGVKGGFEELMIVLPVHAGVKGNER